MDNNKIVQSLWVGPKLSTMEQLSIRSFLLRGHQFHLYTYGPCEDVPDGAVVMDANEILPKSEIKKYVSLANFSDVFRYHLLQKRAPWWVDLDVICLKHFDFEDDHVFASESFPEGSGKLLVNGCVMKAGSKFLKVALDRCAAQDGLHPKGEILNGVLALGPELLTTLCGEMGLVRSVYQSHIFSPIACERMPKDAIDPNFYTDLKGCYAIHLFHSQWGGRSDETFPAGCLYEELKREFSGVPKTLKWSILILTMPQRKAMLERLLAVLRPQVLAKWEEVELCVRESDPSIPVGEQREMMRQASKGEYISFIDDDDMVPPIFVNRILPLLDGVDYVGFNLEQSIDGRMACLETGSLLGGVGISADGVERHRDIRHLNPMRRELALQVSMHGYPGEDSRWANEIRDLGIVKTEHYLNETLYYYLTRTVKPELQDPNYKVSAGIERCAWSFMPKTKIKMLVSIAGNAEPLHDLPDFSFGPGQIVAVHPHLAEIWVATGKAELLEEEPESVKVAEPDVKSRRKK